MKKIFRIAPLRIIILIISAVIIGLFRYYRDNYNLMNFIASKIIKPLRMMMSFINSVFPFSVAELLIAVFVIWLALFILVKFLKLISLKKNRGAEVFKLFLTPISLGLMVYAGFCILWGVYYYGDDFTTTAGIRREDISVEQLETVTQYFANLSGIYSSKVDRDLKRNCCIDRKEILNKSSEVYRNTIKRWPCLMAPNVKAKGIVCSKVMSMIDFTGFFFPFTGEANVNMDSPVAFFPATVAHELAHLRGVAKEDEANFVAVIASMEYGDDDYIYSASLMAYTYLSNALHGVDYEAWDRIYSGLDDNVKRDLSENKYYWDNFKGTVETISNNVYEGFLQSYDQELGLKSYGACVDLIVDYYYDLLAPAPEPAEESE